MRRRRYDLVLAEFRTADDVLVAVDAFRERGVFDLETYSPFAIPGAPDRMGLQRSRLPRLVFVAGVIGAVLAYGIQWFADAWDYPLNVGGRPAHAVWAFIPATFEGTVLCAALAAFLGVFLLLRLPALWHPVFEIDGFDRATIDRYWISVDLGASFFNADEARRMLEALAPLRVVRIEGDQ